MTPEEKRELCECSIQGFVKRFQSKGYANANEAFIDTMQYISRINLDNELTTCNINELLHVAKNEMAKFIAKEQIERNEEKSNNFTNDQGDNKLYQQFFNDPVKFTGELMDHLEIPSNENQDPEYAQFQQSYKTNVKLLSSYLKTNAAQLVFNDFEKKDKTIDVLSGIESRLPDGRFSIDKAFEKQKPGFFEKLRGKTSKEYKDFKATFQGYRSNDSELYGNDKALEESALAYLHHKFPNLPKGQLPTPEQIAKLSGAGKPRADFCLKVVESVRTNRMMKPFVNNVLDASKNPEFGNAVLNQSQQDFQHQIEDDVKEEALNNNENEIVENNNEIAKENNGLDM